MIKPVKALLSKMIVKDFVGVDRNSVQYFDLLRARVKTEGTFINKVYRLYYSKLMKNLNKFDVDRSGLYLELGSGYGFFQDFSRPQINLIRSDVVQHDNLDQIVNAEKLPFDDATVSAIFMFGVLHHIKTVDNFFDEAKRCLKKGGAVIMIEPTGNRYSEIMYRLSHTEPFDRHVKDWIIPGEDPMTCANLALPYVIFERDRAKFIAKHKELKIRCNHYHSPLLFQMSGNEMYNPPLGHWSYYLFRCIDFLLTPLSKQLGMFSTIVLQKAD